MKLLQVLSVELGKLPNSISVEGHTDSHPYSTEANYGNWELSSDRANVARRLMQTNGIRPDQVSQVRGFADQRLRKPESPLDASNRRISLIVQYLPDHTKLGTMQDVAAMNRPVVIPAAESSKTESLKTESSKSESAEDGSCEGRAVWRRSRQVRFFSIGICSNTSARNSKGGSVR